MSPDDERGLIVLGLRRRQREEIDLREGARDVRGFGYPTSCPECGGRGYLDHLDLIDRTQEQHCTACGHKWIDTEAELTHPA